MAEEITHQFPNNAFEVILSRLDSVDSNIVGLNSRRGSLEDRVERRLMETRPIWEQVLIRLDGIDSRFDGIELRFDGVDSRFDEVQKRFELIDVRFNEMEKRFDGFDRRFDAVEARLGGLETRLERVENRLGKVEYELYGLGKKFRLFNREILDVQNAHEDLEERVIELEKPGPT